MLQSHSVLAWSLVLSIFLSFAGALPSAQPETSNDVFKNVLHRLEAEVQRLNTRVYELETYLAAQQINRPLNNKKDDHFILPTGSFQGKAVTKPTGCSELYLYGHSLPGYYSVKKSSTELTTVFCDFGVGFGNPDYETVIGYNDIKTSSGVYFFVTGLSNNGIGVMTFSNTETNIGNAMSASSGTFTAPVAGNYYFAAGANKDSDNPSSDIQFYRNSESVAYSYCSTASNSQHCSVVATIVLAKNDKVTLRGGSNNNFGTAEFTGYLIEETLSLT